MQYFLILGISFFAGLLYRLLIKKIGLLIHEPKKISALTTFTITTTSLFAVFFLSPQTEIVFNTVFTLLLIPIFFTDTIFYLIPDVLTLPAIGIVLVHQLYRETNLTNLGIAAFIAGGFFLLQYIVSSGRWIGSGDIRLGILMGLGLGIQKTIVALLLAYVGGALAGIILICLKKKELTSKFPFGTLLTTASFLSLLFGQQISNAYLKLIGY